MSAPFWLTLTLLSAFGFYASLMTGAVLSAIGFNTLFIVTFVFLRYYGNKRPLMSFEIVFAGIAFLYAVAVPLSMTLRDTLTDSIVTAYRMTFDGSIGFLLVFTLVLDFLRFGRREAAGRPHDARANYPRTRLAAYGLILFGILASIVVIELTSGLMTYIQAGYAGRSSLKLENGPIELGFYFTIVGVIILGTTWFLEGRLKGMTLIALALMVLALSGVFIFIGIRRPIFFLVVGLAIAFNVAGWRLPLLRAGLLGLAGLFLLGTFASYRQVLAAEGVMTTIQFIANNFDPEWLDLSRSELGAPFQVLLFALDEWPQEDLYFNGSTLLWVIPNILPRSLGFYTLSLSEQYTLLSGTARFLSIGGTYGSYPIAEGYLNFGQVGPFLFMAITGAGFAVAVSLLERLRADPIAAALLGTLTAWIAFYIRMDMASIMKMLVYGVLIQFALAYVLRWLLRLVSPSWQLRLARLRRGRLVRIA